MRFVTITDERTGAILADRAGWCSSHWHRFRGLMLQGSLSSGHGIVLVPCASVHMALMRFAIDVVYLDRERTVLKLVRNLQPYRISFGGRGAHSVVELPEGTLDRLELEVGDHLGFEEAPVEARLT